MESTIVLTTMCLVWDKKSDKVVMINRQHGGWRGYAPPGGHVDFPESFVDCAIREVYEETGLVITELLFKGITQFVNTTTQERYIIFNYLTHKFRGCLHAGTNEGVPEWIALKDTQTIGLAPGIKERLPLFFAENPSEMHIIWDSSGRHDLRIL